MLPWLGYFNKLSEVDKFIFLDDVQIPKGRSWLNRSHLLANGKKIWGTIPLKSYHGLLCINQVEYSSDANWRQGYLDLLSGIYSRHPHFLEIKNYLEESIRSPEQKLDIINRSLIKRLVKSMNLKMPEFILASSLKVYSSGTERICELTKLVGGNTYLCGGGSKGYLDESLFSKFDISLEYQNFKELEYPQFRSIDFVSSLSVVDLLMNCGFENASKYIV